MSFGQSISSHCRNRVMMSPRRFTSGTSNGIEAAKMHAKSIVINQWKLINQLKTYFSRFTTDKTFENALNKEFAHFLQKVDSKVYGSDLVRYFTASETSTTEKNTKKSDVKQSESGLSLPNVLNGLKLNLQLGSNDENKKPIVPKWKTDKPSVSKASIMSRTHQVVSSVLLAETEKIQFLKVEELVNHLKQYPDAKHVAVKEGAIRALLRIRQHAADTETKGALNEGLALLGHTDPVPGSGIRILSIDGGGIRGILVIEMLRKLEEFTGKPIQEMFDFICGVSTGSIIASSIGLKQKTLEEISEIYKTCSLQIFSQSALKGTSNLVWSHSYYDTALWEKLLKDQWQDTVLIETRRNPKVPKYCAVSAVVNQSRLSAYVFRNYSLPCRVQSQYLGGHDHKVWESVRASAAAPTYFEELKIGNMLHQDGGILVNNPTAVALHEAKLLWPTTPIQCVVSCGTGRTAPNPIDSTAEPSVAPVSNSSWKKKFLAILDSATDTEGVHTMLQDLLPANAYYRFNPYLTEMLDMSEIEPKKLELLKRDALMYLRTNEDKFKEAAKALKVGKSPTQKVMDWINIKKGIHGLTQI